MKRRDASVCKQTRRRVVSDETEGLKERAYGAVRSQRQGGGEWTGEAELKRK